MIIDCISDLHGFYPRLDGGDLLIIAGDLVGRSDLGEYLHFTQWMHEQDYRKIMFIAGNHDTYIEKKSINPSEDGKVCYLCDSFTEFDGLKIYGSPWTATFPGINPHCTAFACSDEELENRMDIIPYDEIDILITHCPPYAVFDSVKRRSGGRETIDFTGSKSLKNGLLDQSSTVKLHVFGHIHEWGGRVADVMNLKLVNASIVNERYEHVNKPVRIEL